MAKKHPQITISKQPGDAFPDIESAQRSASVYIARDMAALVRSMIDNGLLEVKDGQIIPRTS